MRSVAKFLGLFGLVLYTAASCFGATISGTVKGPDGAPLEGAFVQARNTKTKMTFVVLSDHAGHYRVEKLPAGDYQVQARATGFHADPQNGVTLTADQTASLDFSVVPAPVRWNELSIYQAKKLWPEEKAKETIFTKCFICHGFQTRMASVRRDADGWQDRVQFMRDSMHFSLSYRITDQDAAEVATYLHKLYGDDSAFPRSPAELPGYKETVRPFSSEAMNIAYVEYDMPGPSRMPFSAAPAKDGSVWIPNFGLANKISRLNPKTGEMQDFPVPNDGTAAVHSAIAAPDGSVWLTEQGSDKLGRWDPITQKITEYQHAYAPGLEGREDGGSRHTVRIDSKGMVWSSGYPLTRFDPETRKFYDFPEAAHTYSLDFDKDENVWFTNPGTGQIGKVDAKTMKVTQWTPPTLNTYERRLVVDSDGTIWFGEYQKGKIGHFDPRTQSFKEYDCPGGADSFPYAMAIGSDHSIWYSSYYLDVIGRLDPKTGKITEYPFPHSENTIREFFRDSEGKIWYGSPSNNKVGYFYLKGTPDRAGN
ncbi:MAG TPA: carboxypeptidase regulatory-like domain-containing protein [Candidatus Acidoferrales bacterium]|nr:carboxypeptidase regulatory-like domain-containing protein [Candidatus Acidoferrales bacterium]